MDRITKSKKIFSIILSIALIVTSINIIPSNSSANDKNKKAIAAYDKLLSRNHYNWSKNDEWNSKVNKPKYYKFSCIDLNGDGVKELVLENTNASWADCDTMILKYMNGKIKRVLKCHGITWYKKSKIISVEDAHTGIFWGNYYKIRNNGKLINKAEYSGTTDELYRSQAKHKENIGDMTIYYTSYKINGKEKSYKKYRKELKRMLKGGKKTKIKLYENSVKNRASHLIK